MQLHAIAPDGQFCIVPFTFIVIPNLAPVLTGTGYTDLPQIPQLNWSYNLPVPFYDEHEQ